MNSCNICGESLLEFSLFSSPCQHICIFVDALNIEDLQAQMTARTSEQSQQGDGSLKICTASQDINEPHRPEQTDVSMPVEQ
ncbi:hypothetical protein AMS68_001001 [Peltaster fructicola]|uniref:Uncharacterized protein n=1 Tax=Peltaster fructicola TaxID=286661 RepID=A0A6H0XL80_9PEZI|nr:hypothetical protein AMS68_001001 [Peltaster fructicola]